MPGADPASPSFARVDELLGYVRSGHVHAQDPCDLAVELERDGMLEPVVLRTKFNKVLAIDDGNTRLKAAALLGWEWVPVVRR